MCPRMEEAKPPSTTIFWPVTYRASSESKKAATSAISSGSPTRPKGTTSFRAFANSLLEYTFAVNGVRIIPGAIELHRIPSDAHSIAIIAVTLIHAALEGL